MSDEYGIGRHVANLFVTQTYEGQSDIHCKCLDVLNLSLTDDNRSFDPRSRNHRAASVLLI